MQNEITVRPLVDILSEQLGEQVVMSAENYVLFRDSSIVSSADVESATAKQEEERQKAIKQQLEQSVQQHIDAKAKELGYDNISSVGKYLGYENPFKVECEKLGVFNSNCWIRAFEVMKEVEGGVREIPTAQELIALLPTYGQAV